MNHTYNTNVNVGCEHLDLAGLDTNMRSLDPSTRPRMIFDRIAPGKVVEDMLAIGNEKLAIECGFGSTGTLRIFTERGQLETAVAIAGGVAFWTCYRKGCYRIEIENHHESDHLEYVLAFTLHNTEFVTTSVDMNESSYIAGAA